MSLKKNAVSYIMWMIMLLFTGVVFAFLGMVTARIVSSGNNPVLAAVFIAGFFLVLFLLYLLTGLCIKLSKPFQPSSLHDRLAPFLEGLAIGLCISAGVAVRVALLDLAGEDGSYFELAKVTQQGSVSFGAVQGSVYYYCVLLHGVFRIFGNKWIAGIWLQIVLQMLGCVLFYFAIRRLTDKWPAMLSLLFLCLAPVSIDAGLTYSPQMMFFCIFSLILLILANYLYKSGEAEQNPVAMWIYTVVAGVLVGIACYVDVAGVLFLLLIPCIGMVKRPVGKYVLWFLRALVILGTALGTFWGMILLDSILSGSTFVRVMNAWFVTYSTIGFRTDIFSMGIQLELIILVTVISIGVFSFWRRKQEERFTPFVLLIIGAAVLYFCSITADNMDGSYLLYALLSVLAAIAVTELFYREKTVAEKKANVETPMVFIELDEDEEDVPMVQDSVKEEPVKEEPIKEKAVKEKAVKEKAVKEKRVKEKVIKEKRQKEKPLKNQSVKQEAVKKQETDEKAQKTKFIENPLPLPRKHIKKIMDFAFVPDESDMKYDIQVSDSDDFDI